MANAPPPEIGEDNSLLAEEEGESESCGRIVAGRRRTSPFTRGLGRPFISNIERGQKEPCLRSLEILAIAFDLSLSQLLSRV